MGNIYLLYVRISVQLLKKKWSLTYWIHVNNSIPEKIKHNTKCHYDPTIQNFMRWDPSYLKLENIEGPESDGQHVRNKMTLTDENLVYLRSHMWIQSVRCRLLPIYIFYLELIRISRWKKRKNNKDDADTMYGNTSLQVTQKVYASHC